MNRDELLTILRNPHGRAEASIRKARLAAADEIERLEKLLEPREAEGNLIRIEVRGGCVVSVDNVPPGCGYEIIDHDSLDGAAA